MPEPRQTAGGADEVSAVELLAEPLVGVRSGCLVHRLLHRLGAVRPPLPAYAADTPDAAKHLVAAGLGVTVLPDFGLAGDPLERHGAVTWRPLAGAGVPAVHLMLRRSRTRAIPPSARPPPARCTTPPPPRRPGRYRAEPGPRPRQPRRLSHASPATRIFGSDLA
ncbi:LysR substrate-binding domain-containing protein [Streptomyces sp. B22F1]